MPAHPNALIETEFVTSPGPDDKKSTYLICKHCTTYNKARNTHRAIEHLHNCKGYQAKQQANIDSLNPSQKRQRTLTVPSFPILRKRKLDSMAAMAVYMGARPFRLWEDSYM
jgi:hypothetical protein